ncbi:putative SOS response-associated peptidase YedK [Chitinophaga skermanii]|uniref:Abasic site processing protein n=1 Tax=Chitinophaga skermanii TaxID=331697 RepID=A0A327QDB1_9BACT|nr:SOS response-associated peptidase family protein [Chitinophaga skermanii]RAJ02646.1 putative SOS response-associated peptidase YedK [Chitinophaga skermanii]
MCYDLALSDIKLVYTRFPELKDGPFAPFQPTFHKIAQSYPKWPVVLNPGEKKLQTFEWGVIPNYMRTPEEITKGRKYMVNARSEKVTDPKAYWHKIRHQRCLVPATGFFEHREVPGFKNKIPYFIHTKDQPLLLIAGLYTYSHIPNPETGELPGTFTVLTRAANEVMSKIHNGGDNAGRMPLMLNEAMQEKWLSPGLNDADIASVLQYEEPPSNLEYWTVNPVRRPQADDFHIIEPRAYDNLPDLDGKGARSQGSLF